MLILPFSLFSFSLSPSSSPLLLPSFLRSLFNFLNFCLYGFFVFGGPVSVWYLSWSWKPQKSQNSYFGNHSRTLFTSWSTRTLLPVLDVQLIFYLFSQIWMYVCVNLWPHGQRSLLGSSAHEILQARILEWVVIPFSRGSSWPRDQTQISDTAGFWSQHLALWSVYSLILSRFLFRDTLLNICIIDWWTLNWAPLVTQTVKSLPAMQDTQVQSLGQEDPLEKEMATHSNILAWRISWAEVPDGLQSMRWQRVRHNWETNTLIFFFFPLTLNCWPLMPEWSLCIRLHTFILDII